MSVQTEDKFEEMTPYRRTKIHVGCGGDFRNTGQGYSNNSGSVWLHRCSLCHAETAFDSGFPRIEYAVKGE